MSTAVSLKAVESRIEAADRRVGSELSRLSDALQRLGSAAQRRAAALDELHDELGALQRRFEEKKLVLVVCGATSAGKSTVINAALRRDLLFTAPEHCTPCSVSIEAGPASRAFFTQGKWFEGCRERDLAELHALSDAKSKSASREPLFVFLPSAAHQNSVLRIACLRLVDSPGLYESVDENCVDLEGDAFVFVVDFDAGVQWETLQAQLRSRRDRAVFFVFNRCDIVELFSSARFEQGRREKLNRAVRFLTDNGVFSDDAAAANAVFFLSARVAVVSRKYRAALQQLREAVISSCAGKENPQLLVCGSGDAGKTSLCNDLIGCDLLPLNEASCFVRLQAGGASDPPQLLEALREDLKVRLQKASEGVLRESVAEQLLPPRSLLCHGVAVVDSPSEAFPPDLAPAAVAVVVSGAISAQKQQRSIQHYLKQCGDAAPLLVVTKMNEVRSNEGEERARLVAEELRGLWRRVANSEAVFFLEKEALMDKYGAAFDAFEQQLVAAGHEHFAEFKLRRIEAAAAETQARLNEELRGAAAEIAATEAAFRAAPEALLASAAAREAESAHVDRFLRKEEGALPRDAAEVEAMVTRFLAFLREDLARQLQAVGEESLEALGQLDGRAQEAGRALLEADIASLRVEEEVELQALQQALPPPMEDVDAAEERRRALEERKRELAQRRTELVGRRERLLAQRESAVAMQRERSAVIAARAERTHGNEAQIREWQRESATLRESMDAARRSSEQAEAEADEARLEADKWMADAAAADEMVRALTKTIDRLDKPMSYVLNFRRAIRCPDERRKRTQKEHEASAHRIKEKEARARQKELKARAERQKAAREKQQLALSALEQKIALTSAIIQEAASETAQEERKREAAAAEAREAEQQLSSIEEELQKVDKESQEVDSALQAAEAAVAELKKSWAAKMEALPRVLRAQLDQLVQRSTRKAVQGLQATLTRFVEAEVPELRRERTCFEDLLDDTRCDKN